MNTAIVTFTLQGNEIVKKLSKTMTLVHYSKELCEDFQLSKLTKTLMEQYDAIIFVGALGIAVRAIAPYITSKDKDPAVIVIDNGCKYVISLLSGHLGGANELCLKLSSILKAEAVITTATDSLGIEAPDIVAKNHGLLIEDLKKAKVISSLLVAGKKVAFYDEKGIISLPSGYVPKSQNLEQFSALVLVTNKIKNIEEDSWEIPVLRLIRKDIVLGIGCKKNYSEETMLEKVKQALMDNNIDFRAVKALATVEIKKDERAIIKLKEALNCNINIFTLEEIKRVQHKYEGSDFVENVLGVRAVCEPCVELSGAKCLTYKLNLGGMTLCIGEMGDKL